jgi:pyruvate dehydrogenase E2 component (dihydrolipoamide acetyltransferase)
VVDDNVVPRLILPLSVSFDHRIIDGAHAIPFMREIVNLLEKPARLRP